MSDFVPQPRSEPSFIAGARAPEDQLSNKVVIDMQDKIHLIRPAATPFLTLTGKIKGKRVAKNLKFEHMEKDFKPRKLTISGAQTDVDTTIEVVAGDGTKVAINDVIQNTRTGELFLATATPAADAIAVTRGIGGAPVAMLDGDVAVILNSSYPDYSLLGSEKSIQETAFYNYTQIFRTPFSFTGRDLVTEFYGGDDQMNETKWQSIEHKTSIEYAMFFGKRHLIAAGGGLKQRTFTGGLDWHLNTNAWNVSGVTLTKKVLDEFLEEGLRWGKGGTYQGAGTKYLLASSRWITAINQLVNNQLQYRTLDKQIGFKAMEYVSAHGTMLMVRSPLLDAYHSDRAYLVDLNHIDYVVLRRRDTKLLDNRQENDRDGQSFEYFTDCGLQVQEEFAHTKLFGLD